MVLIILGILLQFRVHALMKGYWSLRGTAESKGRAQGEVQGEAQGQRRTEGGAGTAGEDAPNLQGKPNAVGA